MTKIIEGIEVDQHSGYLITETYLTIFSKEKIGFWLWALMEELPCQDFLNAAMAIY